MHALRGMRGRKRVLTVNQLEFRRASSFARVTFESLKENLFPVRNLDKSSFEWEARALPGASVPAGEAGGNSALQRPQSGRISSPDKRTLQGRPRPPTALWARGSVVSAGFSVRPRELETRYPQPAGLPSTPSELTVMSRTPRRDGMQGL